MKRSIAVLVITVGAAVLLMAGSAHRGVASVGATPVIPNMTLGAPLAPPHLTADGAIQIVKNQGVAKLFRYAKGVTTSFGSRTPSVRFQGNSLPTKDYWAVTLTGLGKDSNGADLLPREGSVQQGAAPPGNTVTFYVDDELGKVVEIDY
jgi:hypothetical protein